MEEEEVEVEVEEELSSLAPAMSIRSHDNQTLERQKV